MSRVWKPKGLGVASTFLMILLLTLAGCGKDSSAERGLEVFDVSGSGRTEVANLIPVAEQRLLSYVAAMKEGDTITAYGFNYKPGASCPVIWADFPNQPNSETANRLKQELKVGVAGRFNSYVECLTNDEHGYSGGGSAIFGAVAEALIKAETATKVTWIHVITDGCTYGEGIKTCSPSMDSPGFAKKVIKALPSSLKPDLSGRRLIVEGLGQGTDLQAAKIAILREIWTLYGGATGASVTFK